MGKIRTNKRRFLQKAFCIKPADVTVQFLAEPKSLLLDSAPSSMEGVNLPQRKDSDVNNRIEDIINIKTDMLDVVKDDLYLKLEMNAIKEQFLSLLKNFDGYQNTQPDNKSKMSQSGTTLLCSGLSTRSRARAMAESRRRPTTCTVDENSNKLQSIEDLPVSQKPYTPRYNKSQRKICTCKGKKHQCSKYKLSTIAEEDKENLLARQKRHRMNVCKAKDNGACFSLKEPMNGDYVKMRQQQLPLKSRGDQTSVWDSVDNKTAVLSSDDYTMSPKKTSENILAGLSPMKFVNRAVINKLDGAKNIKDISVITDVSQVSLREQNSAVGLDLQNQGPLHSTVCYPLHSTMNRTQMNHIGLNQSLEDFSDIEPQGSSDNASETASKISSSKKKTIKFPKMRQLKVPSHVRKPVHVVPHECVGALSPHSPPNMRPDDTFTIEESQDTGCDSSYLTDYEDGKMYNHFTPCNNYVPTYDQRHGSMKMMKRQTARIDLEQTKPAKGLLNTDNLYNHLSMVGNRGSMSDLTTIASPKDADLTVKVTKKRCHDNVDSSLKPQSIGAECVNDDSDSHGSTTSNIGRFVMLPKSSDNYKPFVKLPKREDPQGMTASPSKSSLLNRFQKPSKKARYSTGYEFSYSTNNSTKSSLQSSHVVIDDRISRNKPAVTSLNIKEDHKRKLARRMRRFNKDFQRSESLGNLSNIKTLAHF